MLNICCVYIFKIYFKMYLGGGVHCKVCFLLNAIQMRYTLQTTNKVMWRWLWWFNTIIPQQLIHKLVQLGLNMSLCNWLLDFLTGRPQAVWVGSNTSSTITLNTGPPQGCVLSPLLFTLLTHDCTQSHNSNRFIKFADDTTVVGLISNRDETNYRNEVSRLAGVVQWQQSLSECGEDEGDCRWLQESALSACSSDHQWCDRGESEQHQVPGCAHHRGPLLDQQHCSTSQESTTASLLPPQTKKSQSPGPHHVAPSTEAPSRAFWLAASLCGMAPATHPAASPFNG